MIDKDDLRRIALAMDGVTENESYAFQRDGKNMIWPYLERVHPKKARVPRYDQYLFRVTDLDHNGTLCCSPPARPPSATAMLEGDPEVFFTTDHDEGYHTVIVRLDAIDDDRLAELVGMAWESAPLRTTPPKS